MRKYSQLKAFSAISKASFKSILSNPSALVFSFLFPVIFIFIFGSFGDGNGIKYHIAISDNADTLNEMYDSIKASPLLTIVYFKQKDGTTDLTARQKALERGNISAVINVKRNIDSTASNHYLILDTLTNASGNAVVALQQIFSNIANRIARRGQIEKERSVQPYVYSVREYRNIDFVLPGMLGFSVLFSTLFGISFIFFQFRQQLVLKRFYATPVSKINILLGIGISRLVFQLINVLMLIALGYFFMHFTLVHGFATFLEMTLLTIFMLLLLLGVGLIFSSIVKSDTSIPLFINLFAFPQMLLAGTFFSIEVFPKWLQTICLYVLPLTQFNDAMRKISFTGLHLWDCGKELGILAIWMLVIYAIAIKVFKWE